MPVKYIEKILKAPVYDVARATPLDFAPILSSRLGNRVYLKREDLQPVFSFKLRGAYNKIAGLNGAERARGVIAASAGNHAQGVALGARELDVRALIVMPKTTPPIKVASVRRLGAEIEGNQYREADIDLFRDILEGVVSHQSAIDQLTDRALVEKWPLGRIDATLRAIFRAAGHELTARPDIPPKVIIGEYVDVTKAFFGIGKEAKFTNAVLDHMAREARPGAFSGD